MSSSHFSCLFFLFRTSFGFPESPGSSRQTSSVVCRCSAYSNGWIWSRNDDGRRSTPSTKHAATWWVFLKIIFSFFLKPGFRKVASCRSLSSIKSVLEIRIFELARNFLNLVLIVFQFPNSSLIESLCSHGITASFWKWYLLGLP